MDGMGVELVGFDAIGIVQRCFQRVLDAIDLIANLLGLHDAFRRIGGEGLEMRIETLEQRISDGIPGDRRDREGAATKRVWLRVEHVFPLSLMTSCLYLLDEDFCSPAQKTRISMSDTSSLRTSI